MSFGLRMVMAIVAVASVATFAGSAQAAKLPRKVGQCVQTSIKQVESRLEGTP